MYLIYTNGQAEWGLIEFRLKQCQKMISVGNAYIFFFLIFLEISYNLLSKILLFSCFFTFTKIIFYMLANKITSHIRKIRQIIENTLRIHIKHKCFPLITPNSYPDTSLLFAVFSDWVGFQESVIDN